MFRIFQIETQFKQHSQKLNEYHSYKLQHGSYITTLLIPGSTMSLATPLNVTYG